MRVQRSTFIAQLEQVKHGLSPKDIVDQSSCFAFRDGKVFTFNDELACWGPSEFVPEGGGIAVPAAPLLALLPKLPDEELDFQATAEGLKIRGKNKRVTLRTESEIRLPIDTVEIAAESAYFEVPAGFVEGLSLVEGCAGTDDARFQFTCIHLTGKWVEACDNVQMARYRVKLPGLGKDTFLIRKEAVKSVLTLDVAHAAVSGNWMFFRDGRDVVVACRRYKEEYPDLSSVIDAGGGEPADLPKGLGDAAANAAIFSADNVEDDHILVKLQDGIASITGEGAAGAYNERRRVTYAGPPVSFRIAPKLLAKITTEHPACRVSDKTLRVQVGRLTYVVALSVPGQSPTPEGDAE